VRDDVIVRHLAAACVERAVEFNPQNAANSLWAVATLGLRDVAIVRPLADACVAQSGAFQAQGAVNSLWAAATLGLSDYSVFAGACVRFAPSFMPQEAANSLWAVATLGIREDAVVGPLAAACVAQSRSFNAQNAANSLWAAATLGLRDEAFYRALVGSARTATLNDEGAQQLLYVHAATRSWLAPPLFSPELLGSFRARILQRGSTASQSQRDVAASLSRLGFSVELEARVLDGLHAVDVLVHLPGGALVAVEFDGPTHFLRSTADKPPSRTPVLNGATLFRDRLLREGGFGVVAVPFFEWAALVGDAERDDYLSGRVAAAGGRTVLTSPIDLDHSRLD
jgi:hypothetical protein